VIPHRGRKLYTIAHAAATKKMWRRVNQVSLTPIARTASAKTWAAKKA